MTTALECKVESGKDIPMLENHLEYYRKSGGATRKKILGCIFAEIFDVENMKKDVENMGRGEGEKLRFGEIGKQKSLNFR